MRVEFLEERQVFAAWIAQGPGPTINAQVSVSPNDDINGGIQAIAPHPSDGNTVYVGATNGGVWKTTNASSSSPNWIPLTDGLRSQSISDVQFDVTDATFQTLIVGTGRLSNFAQRGDEEIGLYYTTNGGSAWTTISDPLLVGQKIMGVAVRGSSMLAGSLTGGMVRSTNGGLTWANISGANGLTAGGIYTLVADPSNTNRFYTAVVGVGVFRTDDAGANWNDVTAGLTGIGPDRYIRIAVHHSLGNNVVYIAVAGSGAGSPTRVFRSTNQGANWTALDTVVVHNGGQQFPDTSLAADPTNPNIV